MFLFFRSRLFPSLFLAHALKKDVGMSKKRARQLDSNQLYDVVEEISSNFTRSFVYVWLPTYIEIEKLPYNRIMKHHRGKNRTIFPTPNFTPSYVPYLYTSMFPQQYEQWAAATPKLEPHRAIEGNYPNIKYRIGIIASIAAVHIRI